MHCTQLYHTAPHRVILCCVHTTERLCTFRAFSALLPCRPAACKRRFWRWTRTLSRCGVTCCRPDGPRNVLLSRTPESPISWLCIMSWSHELFLFGGTVERHGACAWQEFIAIGSLYEYNIFPLREGPPCILDPVWSYVFLSRMIRKAIDYRCMSILFVYSFVF